jgi:hypothetical protein
MADAVSESTHGLMVETAISAYSPKAERRQGLAMIQRLKRTMRPAVIAADRGYHK